MMEISTTAAAKGNNDKSSQSLAPFIVTPAFFPHHESLRAQFEWRCAISRARGTNLFTETVENGKYLIAGLNVFFIQDIVSAFLSRLRSWARDSINVSHASSPELHAFPNDCWQLPCQDETPARWRYLYMLGPRDGNLTPVTLLDEAPFGIKSVLAVRKTTFVEMQYNSLLTFRSALACGIEKSAKCSEDILSSTVLLTGYLW